MKPCKYMMRFLLKICCPMESRGGLYTLSNSIDWLGEIVLGGSKVNLWRTTFFQDGK
jgi:hypothetical protein